MPALLLHGLVIGGLPQPGTPARAEPAVSTVRVRAPAAQPVPALVAPSAAVAVPPPSAAPAPVVPRRAETPVAARRPVDAPAAPPLEAAAVAPAVVAEAPRQEESAAAGAPFEPAAAGAAAENLVAADEPSPLLLAAAVVAAPAGSDRAGGADAVDGVAIPVYPTVFPPSQTLRYHLQRGILGGTGELTWRREAPADRPGGGYELQLQARIGSLTVLTQISKGGIDGAGLAPLRFTDQRLRGSVRAANFQRQRDLISFSGPSVEYPLVRGVQDRLSWMMQVPAILAANPRLAGPGQKVTMYVVGARGDAAIWDFAFEARERVTTPGGDVATVKFSRQPRKEYDTLAEVWLDPARHFLPVKARIGNPEEGAMLELRRVE